MKTNILQTETKIEELFNNNFRYSNMCDYARKLANELDYLQSEINSIYGDAVKYPQLALPARQLERLEKLVK